VELEALQEMYPQVQALGASMIAIAPQLEQYARQIADKRHLTFPILTDSDNRVAAQFGLAFVLPEPLKEVYSGFGIDLVKFNGNASWTLPMPGRFIIDSTGIIRNAAVHADHTQRPDPAEILPILRSIL
jgi:peroxiredoxin